MDTVVFCYLTSNSHAVNQVATLRWENSKARDVGKIAACRRLLVKLLKSVYLDSYKPILLKAFCKFPTVKDVCPLAWKFRYVDDKKSFHFNLFAS